MMSKIDAFEFVNSVNYTKKDIIAENESAEKDYVAWLTNNALSYFPDTLYHANMMNSNYHLDNKLQYQYLLNSIRPKKRYSKWFKKTENKDLENIMKAYNFNIKVAKQVLKLLSQEQLSVLDSIVNQDKQNYK